MAEDTSLFDNCRKLLIERDELRSEMDELRAELKTMRAAVIVLEHERNEARSAMRQLRRCLNAAPWIDKFAYDTIIAWMKDYCRWLPWDEE